MRCQEETKKETYKGFSSRIARTIKQYPVDVIDKTIDSMERRLQLVIKGKGGRTKYYLVTYTYIYFIPHVVRKL